MQVNRDWYDGTTYTLYANSQPIIECLTDTINTKIRANTEKFTGEWDKSICPWKINYQADFINPDYTLAWNNNNTWETFTSPLLKERKKGYTFYLSYSSSNMQDRYDRDKYFANYLPSWMALLTNPELDLENSVYSGWIESKYDKIAPVVMFDYSKIFVIPTINNNLFNPNIEANFDPTTIHSIGFAFFYKNQYDFGTELRAGAVLLNNKLALPEWSADCTNSWKLEDMIDNGCFITPYWVRSSNLYRLSSLGTRPNIVDMPWRSSSEEMIPDAINSNFSTQSQATKSAAASINYFPNKAIYITAGHSEIYDDLQAYTAGGLGNFKEGVRRYLKSSVTYEQLVDYLKTQCAYLGFRFLIDSTKMDESINSEYFYIPEIDSVGVTTGNYYQANTGEAQLMPNYQWNTNVFEQTPYDGTNDDEEDDPNTYSDSSGWNDASYVDPNLSFTQVYLLDDFDVGGLGSKFYESLSIKPTDQLVSEFFAETYLTTEPTDVIISLRYFNINLEDNVSHSSTKQALSFGTYDTSVMAYTVMKTTERYSYGEHLYYPHFGDFRDYAPYSSAILIIPYCGSVDIDPAEFMGHWIRVQMVIDFVTGTCTAYILKDELIVNSISGQIGIEVPVTAIAAQDLSRNLFNGYQNLKSAKLSSAQGVAQGAMSFIGAAASSNPLGMASAAMNTLFAAEQSQIGVETAEYNLEHTRIPFRQVGSINPASAFKQEQACRLIIFRPEMDATYDAETYGHITGFKTLENNSLANYTGYTVCAAADTSGITATLRERQQLKELLLSGIYL